MNELIRRLLRRPFLAFEILLASFLINLLAFADTVFVMIVLRRYIAYGFDGTLFVLTAGALVALLLQYLLREARTVLAGRLGRKPDEESAQRVMDALMAADFQAVDAMSEQKAHDTASALRTVQESYDAPAINAVMDAPFAFAFIAAIYLLSPALAMVAGAGVLFVILVSLVSGRMERKNAERLSDVTADARALLGSSANNPDTVRMFGGAEFYASRFKRQSRRVFGLRRKSTDDRGLGQSVNSAVGAFVRVGIYAVGAKQVVDGTLTFPALIGAGILGSYAIQKIMGYNKANAILARAGRSSKRIKEFLDIPRIESTGQAAERKQEAGPGAVTFDNVEFAYAGAGRPVFSSLSARIEPGAVVGVVGRNGVGKTTLARLLLGLLQPTSGSIDIDGLEPHGLDAASRRNLFSYMPQDPVFVGGSVRDNIVMGNDAIDDAELERIVSVSGLKRFLDSSPRGLETRLAPRAANLPLGIRKRLLLARAMAGGGSLIVMDEPTDGMDAEGSAAVYAVLNELTKAGRTIVAISHDANILKAARVMIDLNGSPAPAVIRPERGGQGDGQGATQ